MIALIIASFPKIDQESKPKKARKSAGGKGKNAGAQEHSVEAESPRPPCQQQAQKSRHNKPHDELTNAANVLGALGSAAVQQAYDEKGCKLQLDFASMADGFSIDFVLGLEDSRRRLKQGKLPMHS